MSDFKRVILKDPVTGDFLAPKVPGTLMYEEVNGTEEAPFSTAVDADTLGGYPAAAFVLAENADFALNAHKHSAADITSGILPVVRGGTGVASLAELATAIAPSLGGVKIQTGSYTGTGAAGASNPTRITFNFVPKAVIIVPENLGVGSTYLIYATSLIWLGQAGNASNGCAFTLSGTTLSFYSTHSTDDAGFQMNTSGKKHHWIALG